MSISSITCANKNCCSVTSPHSPFSHESSLSDRRERNKAASAKYRTKKNMEYHGMKNTIQEITARNELLKAQLEELHKENEELRLISDKMKGFLMADQWLQKQKTSFVSHELFCLSLEK
ncbi:hypothetical protein CU098_011703 [Rhizopus stolonifer]|uniref:BZIP domain-containing protein n=1 Tax=Rhizopus stolonifer TaxID=4846 RepID=A0A367KVN0_RHIST|nr:hypothetical protein CU098_011703 [Rhizopus stolonifer]